MNPPYIKSIEWSKDIIARRLGHTVLMKDIMEHAKHGEQYVL